MDPPTLSFSLTPADTILANVVEDHAEPVSSDEPGAVTRVRDGSLVPSRDLLARATLGTIRDVTAEVGRLVRATATRVTHGTPVAPLVRALLGADPSDGARVDGETWAARVADAEQAVAIGVQRTAELHERYERAEAALREAHNREHALQAEVTATIERSCAEREAIMRRADDAVATAEAQRAVAARDAEAARAALSAAQQASLAQRNELALARSETARLGAAAEEAEHARERNEREAHAYRTRLAETLERTRTLEVELARIGEERRRAERATLGEQAEREARWQDELSSLRLEHARERDRAQALAEELERQRVEAEARDRREQRLQDELRAISSRADADREDTVRRAQEMVQAAEQARAALGGELEAMRASISTDRARLLEIEAEHEKAVERDAALAAARTMIDDLEAALAARAAEFERTRTRLTETEHELLQTQHDLGTVQRQAEKLCTAHDDLVEDHARVSAFLEDARTTETSLRAQADELRQQICGLESERARLLALECRHGESPERPAGSGAVTGDLEAELVSLRAWSRTLENEVAQAHAAYEQAELRERRLRETIAANEQSQREHEAMLHDAQALTQSAEEERAALVLELETLRTSMASAQRVILEAQEETRVARTEAERLAMSHGAALAEKERVADGAAPAAPKSDAAAQSTSSPPSTMTPTDARVIAVLDTGPAWPSAAGADVHVLAPGDDVVGRIGELGAGRCIVNLAAPGAIAAAATLRTAGVALPLWGTIVVANGERGLGLGQIEVLTRPIDPDLVRSQCVNVAPKNARILAIGSDSSTFIALRQGLIKAGMSVSIAWDLKQATELMEIVRPHMIVLDLALPPRGAAAMVAELARLETTPVLAVLPGSPEQLATFSGAFANLVPVDGARSPQNLLRAVIDAKRAGSSG
jgi:chromosome segregation ATPase